MRTTIPSTPPQVFQGDLFDKSCYFPPGPTAAPPAVGDAKVCTVHSAKNLFSLAANLHSAKKGTL